MSVVNRVLGSVLEALLLPFRTLPPIVGVAVVSLLTAVALLLVFRATSNQARLAAVKRAIHASLFEMRLFSDDLRAVFSAQLELLRHNGTYLALSLVPMVWVAVPLLLLIAQLQFYYGYEGLAPGVPAVVTVQLARGAPDDVNAVLEAPDGIRVETPTLWIPTLRELAWRIVPEHAGEFELVARVGNRRILKRVRVSDDVGWRSPVRLQAGLLNEVLYPAEAPIAAGEGVASVSVSYPERELPVVAGWGVHWMVAYFVLSMAFAFALRGPLKVVI